MDGSKFTFVSGVKILFKYATESSLLIAITSTISITSHAYISSIGQRNISKAQEKLLLWHFMMGHYNIKNTQSLMTIQGVDKDSILHRKEQGT